MKKQITEPDFIGGQGSLTKEEELALSQYFADKKSKKSKTLSLTQKNNKSGQKVVADNSTSR